MEHDLFTQFKKMYHSFVLNRSFSAVVLSVSLLLKSPSSPVSCQLQVSTLREPRSSGGKMEGHPWMCLKERFSITIMWPSRQITVPHAPCENRKGLVYTHYDLFTFFTHLLLSRKACWHDDLCHFCSGCSGSSHLRSCHWICCLQKRRKVRDLKEVSFNFSFCLFSLTWHGCEKMCYWWSVIFYIKSSPRSVD